MGGQKCAHVCLLAMEMEWNGMESAKRPHAIDGRLFAQVKRVSVCPPEVAQWSRRGSKTGPKQSAQMAHLCERARAAPICLRVLFLFSLLLLPFPLPLFLFLFLSPAHSRHTDRRTGGQTGAQTRLISGRKSCWLKFGRTGDNK